MRRIHQTPRIYYVRTTLGRYESLVSSKSIHYIYVPALDPTYIILIQLLVNYLYNKTKGLIWFPLCYIHVFRVLGIIQKPQCFLENFVYLAMWIITYYVITNGPTGLLLHFLENILKTTTSRGGQYCTAVWPDNGYKYFSTHWSVPWVYILALSEYPPMISPAENDPLTSIIHNSLSLLTSLESVQARSADPTATARTLVDRMWGKINSQVPWLPSQRNAFDC